LGAKGIDMISIPILFAALLLNAETRVVASNASTSQTDDDTRAEAGKDEPRCWEGSEEVRNPDETKRKLPFLPERFDGAKVRITAVALKLCIDSDGKVARTFVLTSSGNTEVDEFYRSALSKWTFEPAFKEDHPVPSVFTITVNWNPR
jgi:TonB family protein